MDPSTLEMISLRTNKDLWDEVSIKKLVIEYSEERSLRRIHRANEASDDKSTDLFACPRNDLVMLCVCFFVNS